MKRIIFDLDNTLSFATNGDYAQAEPAQEVIAALKKYRRQGFEIVISTSRNVRTYQGNLGKINAVTLPVIIEWLNKHEVPYDEIYVGKPWCGDQGFYVDDKAIRPDELINLSYDEIRTLLGIDSNDSD